MKTRRKSREFALQCLYCCDATENWSDKNLNFLIDYFSSESKTDSFLVEIVFGVRDNLLVIDDQISFASDRWSIDRMARVDRNILRLASFEIACLEDIPLNVSINEAVEIAKRFGADDSPMFVNGVLDNVGRSISQNKQTSSFTQQGSNRLKAVG